MINNSIGLSGLHQKLPRSSPPRAGRTITRPRDSDQSVIVSSDAAQQRGDHGKFNNLSGTIIARARGSITHLWAAELAAAAAAAASRRPCPPWPQWRQRGSVQHWRFDCSVSHGIILVLALAASSGRVRLGSRLGVPEPESGSPSQRVLSQTRAK